MQRKIFWLLLLAAGVAVSLFGYALHAQGHDTTVPGPLRNQVLVQLLTMMLTLSSLLTSVVATFAAVSTLSAEIDAGRMQMVVSRPVRREAIYLGHFAGIAIVLAAFSALFYLAIMLVFFGQADLWVPGWAWGLLVFPLSSLLQLALSLLIGSRSGSIAAGIASLILMMFAWIGNLLESFGHLLHLATLELSGVLVGMLLPMAVVNSWVTGHLRHGLHQVMVVRIELDFASDPSIWMLLYAVIWLAIILAGGIWAFRGREL